MINFSKTVLLQSTGLSNYHFDFNAKAADSVENFAERQLSLCVLSASALNEKVRMCK